MEKMAIGLYYLDDLVAGARRASGRGPAGWPVTGSRPLCPPETGHAQERRR